MTLLPQLGSSLSQAMNWLFQAPLVDERTIDECLKQVCTALLTADVNVRLVQELRRNIKESIQRQLSSIQNASALNKQKLVHRTLIDHLCRLVDPFYISSKDESSNTQEQRVTFQPKHNETAVVMFVGLQGSGKTTSLSKLAAWYRRRGWKSAVVAGDTFRAGAFDQLRQNALKAGVAFYGDPGEDDPVVVCREGVQRFRQESFEVILVDTSGRHRQETALFDEMRRVQEAINPQHIVLCVDASIGQAAESQARAFADAVQIGSVFVTKLDSQAKGGGALSAVAACHAPITFVGTGEHLTDVEPFVAKTFVSRILGLGDIKGLISAVNQLDLESDPRTQDLTKRLQQGQFTLRDLQSQFQMVSKLGPLSQLMGMIPGLNNMPGVMGGADAQKNMKRLMIILDSMHRSELDSDGKIFHTQPNRLVRVAKGAGCDISMVKSLLEQHKMASQMVKKLSANPAMMQQMNSMDPQKLFSRMNPQLNSMIGQDNDDDDDEDIGASSSSKKKTSLVAEKRAQRSSRRK